MRRLHRWWLVFPVFSHSVCLALTRASPRLHPSVRYKLIPQVFAQSNPGSLNRKRPLPMLAKAVGFTDPLSGTINSPHRRPTWLYLVNVVAYFLPRLTKFITLLQVHPE